MDVNTGLRNLQQRVVRLRRRVEKGLELHSVDRALVRIQNDVEELLVTSEKLESLVDYEILVRGTTFPGMFMSLPEWYGDMCVAAESQAKKPTTGEKAAKRALTVEVNRVYRAIYGEKWVEYSPASLYIGRRVND